jgi:hypothetical protein
MSNAQQALHYAHVIDSARQQPEPQPEAQAVFQDINQDVEEGEAENEAPNDVELALENPSGSRMNEPAPDIEMEELIDHEQSADPVQSQPAPAQESSANQQATHSEGAQGLQNNPDVAVSTDNN